jgi:signal transduction histidine kinase
MKRCFELLIFLCSSVIAIAQNNLPPVYEIKTDTTIYQTLMLLFGQNGPNVDSLKRVLQTNVPDTTRLKILNTISFSYLESNLDSSVIYAEQAYQISSSIKLKEFQFLGLERMGSILWRRGDAERSIELFLQAVKIEEELKDSFRISILYFDLGNAYHSESDDRTAIDYYSKSLQLNPIHEFNPNEARILMTIGSIYLKKDELDSALIYAQKSYQTFKSRSLNYWNRYLPASLNLLGKIEIQLLDTNLAHQYFKMGIEEGYLYKNLNAVTESYLSIAKIFKSQGKIDSAYSYGITAYRIAKQVNSPYTIEETSSFLKDLFADNNQIDSAFKYQSIMIAAKDSILNIEKIRQIQNLSFAEQQRQQELRNSKIEFQDKIKLYASITAFLILLVISYLLYNSNRNKQKANLLLQQQKEKVESTLSELKSTQAQLVQSEKMASLGELTAGIAHEIQNPLNFVNNFSDVNKELIDELKGERQKVEGERNIELEDEILNDIDQNLEKISLHGKRADAIVKSMLQHTRTSSGQKELTDINKLADEYLRLSYHGMRARDKNFNAEFKTEFDESIGKINVVPQDIGRVLLNLYNNAFYAVSKPPSPRSEFGAGSKGEQYKPLVTVTTRKIKLPANDAAKSLPLGTGGLEIRVVDNGNGIPQNIVDKIFQPFFTTKPTGQGTGLGLSLAYDIIKAHGGEIKVESEEGEGSEFVIQLPIDITK